MNTKQEAPVKPTPPKELNNFDLLELVCQLHSRALSYPSKEMHDAYVEARNEMDLRLYPVQSVQGLREALEDLLEAIPKQTEDADWWEDDLINAVEKAKKVLASGQEKDAVAKTEKQ